jgi:hypothetical protein
LVVSDLFTYLSLSFIPTTPPTPHSPNHHTHSAATATIALAHHGFAAQLKPLLAELRSAAFNADAGKEKEKGASVAATTTTTEGNGAAAATAPGGLGGLKDRALLQPAMVNLAAVRVSLCEA